MFDKADLIHKLPTDNDELTSVEQNIVDFLYNQNNNNQDNDNQKYIQNEETKYNTLTKFIKYLFLIFIIMFIFSIPNMLFQFILPSYINNNNMIILFIKSIIIASVVFIFSLKKIL